jgi:hypothetical protein
MTHQISGVWLVKNATVTIREKKEVITPNLNDTLILKTDGYFTIYSHNSTESSRQTLTGNWALIKTDSLFLTNIISTPAFEVPASDCYRRIKLRRNELTMIYSTTLREVIEGQTKDTKTNDNTEITYYRLRGL